MINERITRRKAAIRGVASLLALSAAINSRAQSAYPSKPVRLLLSFPAGGGTDLIARELAKGLGELWKTPVVVDNKPGASGIIAADLLSKAPPDGHTLFLALYDTLVVTPWVHERLPYDTFRDLIPVGIVATVPTVLVSSDKRIRSMNDLISFAKAEPDTLTFASIGIGSGGHLLWEIFQRMANIKLTHVPYKSIAAAMQDVVAGRVTFIMGSPGTTSQYVLDGRLVPIASASVSRLPQFPTLPSFAEAGFPSFETNGWMGLVAPRGTPAGILDKIGADLKQVGTSRPYIDAIVRSGNEATYATAAEMAKRIEREHESFGKIARQINFKN